MNRAEEKTVVIGTVGAGYAASLHGNGYKKVSGVKVRLKTVCDLNTELAKKIQDAYGYEQICSDSVSYTHLISIFSHVTAIFILLLLACSSSQSVLRLSCSISQKKTSCNRKTPFPN